MTRTGRSKSITTESSNIPAVRVDSMIRTHVLARISTVAIIMITAMIIAAKRIKQIVVINGISTVLTK